jgi:putative transposase
MEPLMSIHVHIANQKRKPRKPLRRISAQQIRENRFEGIDGQMIDTEHALISMMLPPSLKAFFADLDAELTRLCGDRYRHSNHPMTRWGSQPGSIILGGQRVAIQRPRVRDRATNEEVIPPAYARFQDPTIFDKAVFQEGIKRVSQRDYAKGLPKIAASFGVSKASVSRSWIKSTEKQLKTLLERDLRAYQILAVFIDGKRFSKLGVVVALGVGVDGKKHVLGIYQSSTENSAACLQLLEDLERRGLPLGDLLFVVDGGSGLNKALDEKYQIADPERRRAFRVRCHFHKWQNLRDVLDEKGQQEAAPLFWALRDARDMTTAKACSDALEACLGRHNPSALKSYLEAKDDLLAIHRLQIGAHLKKFFSTTNPIESLNSLLEEDLRRVKRWRDGAHFQRWLATACLQNEKRMRKIRGFSSLPALLVRLQELCIAQEAVDKESTAA